MTMDPGEVHYGGAADSAGWRQRVLYVPEATIFEVLEDLMDRPLSAGSLHFRDCFRRDSRAAGILRHLHAALAPDGDELLERQSRFDMVVGDIFQRFASTGARPVPRGAAPQALERARDFLHANFTEPCSLSELARLAGLRRRQFVEAFSRRFSLPPIAI